MKSKAVFLQFVFSHVVAICNTCKLSGRSVSVYTDTSALHVNQCTLISDTDTERRQTL